MGDSSQPQNQPTSQPAAASPGAPPPQQIIIHQSGRSMQRVLTWIGWTGFILCGMLLLGQFATKREYFDTTEGIKERYYSGDKYSRDKVAIIDISGVIMEGEGFAKRQIDRIRQDDNVKAVVLRVNSPGGTITGADYIYHHLAKLRDEKKLPVVASLGGIATSGGYYVAMAVGEQENSIFAEPTTTTGSIGVVIPHYDISGLLERFDIQDDSIASHDRKRMLSMTRPLSEEEREILRGYIGEAFERFLDVVKQGRPVFREDDQRLRQIATGEIFTAGQAQNHGLVDQIGFTEDAIDRAIELADLNKDDVRVVRFRPPVTLLDIFGFAQQRGGFDPSILLDLTAPRAYYLSTTLPALASSRQAGPLGR